MGVPFNGGGPLTVTGTAQSITQLLGLTSATRIIFSHASIRGGTANAGKIFIGRSNVTTSANQFGYIQASESLDIDLETSFSTTDDLYLIAATPGDTVYIILAS